MLEPLTLALRKTIMDAADHVATRTARAARIALIFGGALGATLAALLLAVGILLGKASQ